MRGAGPRTPEVGPAPNLLKTATREGYAKACRPRGGRACAEPGPARISRRLGWGLRCMNEIRNKNFRSNRPRPPGDRNGGAPNIGSARDQARAGSTAMGPATAQRNYERYIALAREAALSGDNVEMENCYQHAEHYFQGDERALDRLSRSLLERPVHRRAGHSSAAEWNQLKTAIECWRKRCPARPAIAGGAAFSPM